MAREFLKYTFYAIGGYLVLVYATNAGHLMLDAFGPRGAYPSSVKVLQGRG